MEISRVAVYIIRAIVLCLLQLPVPLYVIAEITAQVFGRDVEAALLCCDEIGLHLRPRKLEKHRAAKKMTGLVPLILNVKSMADAVMHNRGVKKNKVARR